MWRHQTPSSASTMLPPIRFDQRLSFKLWQITFGWKIQIVGRITSNCWQDKFKLLTSKCWQDGSVSSLRNTCLPLHHRAGDPAVGGSVSHLNNIGFQLNSRWEQWSTWSSCSTERTCGRCQTHVLLYFFLIWVITEISITEILIWQSTGQK